MVYVPGLARVSEIMEYALDDESGNEWDEGTNGAASNMFHFCVTLSSSFACRL